jgi:hypothetical protein
LFTTSKYARGAPGVMGDTKGLRICAPANEYLLGDMVVSLVTQEGDTKAGGVADGKRRRTGWQGQLFPHGPLCDSLLVMVSALLASDLV